jgi:quinol monooxygenase YgiN
MSDPSGSESPGSEPIVFVSHFRVKDGTGAGFQETVRKVVAQMRAEKLRTLAFLIYLDENGRTASIVHVFADAHSMDLHFAGAEQRSSAAYEHIVPTGWEIYGRPSDGVVETMRREAASAEVKLILQHEFQAGFLRLGPG